MNEEASRPSTSADSPMVCPVCRVPLVMTERQNIEVDYCPKCRGVWLDRGELDKIIERSLSQGGAAPSAQDLEYDRYRSSAGGHHGGGHGPGGYRRRSWLREIFD